MKDLNYRLAQDVLFQQVGSEAVLLETTTGQYYTLSEVGAHIIGQINQHPTSDIIDSITKQYQVSREVASDDLNELLVEMLNKSLLIKV